ncbi:MAG TPA: hypothetical protein VF384_19935 [Planctomycetota bacterium]
MTDVDDDWAPLPEDQRTLYPGELTDLRAKPRPPKPALPTAVAPPAAVATEPVVDAAQHAAADLAAERALCELKQRIANSAPSTSLVAEVLHREDRQERRRAASAAVAAAVAPKPAEPPAIEYDPRGHGFDVREDETWFKELPEQERQRLHDAWAQKRQHGVKTVANQRRNGGRRLVACIFVFVVVALLGTRSMWHVTLGAGVCCGIWWWHAAPDRFLDPMRALACFYFGHLIVMVVHGAVNPLAFMDSLLLVGLATLIGFDGEIRRTGGFDSPK